MELKYYVDKQAETIQSQIKTIDSFLEKAPTESLSYSRHDNRWDYRAYYKDGSVWKAKYLSHSDKTLEILFKKDYYSKLRKILQRNLKLCNRFTLDFDSSPEVSIESTLRPCERPLFEQFITPKSEKIKAWQTEVYPQNPYKPEERKIKTLSGDFVRSKSERAIADALYRYGLPFRTDCAFEYPGGIIYTDFVILHPRTLELYYWEHSGMLDDPRYNKNNADRISRYASKGILIGDKLIMTGETSQHILSDNVIEDTIERFFVC